jgi:ABC-type amino acid transport substrate-binding protein
MRSLLGALALLLLPTLAAADTLERMARDGVLRIGYRDTAVPFSFADPTTGRPAGYAVRLCEAIVPDLAAAAGVARLNVTYVPVTAENRFDAVAEGRIDLLCGPATRTLTRRSLVDFSIPTFVDGAGIALRRDGVRSFDALSGRTIAVTRGTTTEEALARTLAESGLDAAVLPVGDHEAGLLALREGRADAYFADRAILQFLVARHGGDDVVVANDQFTLETHALALPRGDADFRQAVDTGLSRLYLTGEVEALFGQAFGPDAVMTDLLRSVYRIGALPR